jgi:DTW domain-containing protein YfiP
MTNQEIKNQCARCGRQKDFCICALPKPSGEGLTYKKILDGTRAFINGLRSKNS